MYIPAVWINILQKSIIHKGCKNASITVSAQGYLHKIISLDRLEKILSAKSDKEVAVRGLRDACHCQTAEKLCCSLYHSQGQMSFLSSVLSVFAARVDCVGLCWCFVQEFQRSRPVQDRERKTSQKMRKSRSVLTVSPNEVSTSDTESCISKNINKCCPHTFGC